MPNLNDLCLCNHPYGEHKMKSLRCGSCKCHCFRPKVRHGGGPEVVFVDDQAVPSGARNVKDHVAEYTRRTTHDYDGSHCARRVWDNGDTTECGAPAARAGFCEEHRIEVERFLAEELETKRADLAGLEQGYERVRGAKASWGVWRREKTGWWTQFGYLHVQVPLECDRVLLHVAGAVVETRVERLMPHDDNLTPAQRERWAKNTAGLIARHHHERAALDIRDYLLKHGTTFPEAPTLEVRKGEANEK